MQPEKTTTGNHWQPHRESWLSRMMALTRARWKVALGLMLVALMLVFVVQNAQEIQVKLLFWEASLSQALVVLLSIFAGGICGASIIRWKRRNSSTVDRT